MQRTLLKSSILISFPSEHISPGSHSLVHLNHRGYNDVDSVGKTSIDLCTFLHALSSLAWFVVLDGEQPAVLALWFGQQSAEALLQSGALALEGDFALLEDFLSSFTGIELRQAS